MYFWNENGMFILGHGTVIAVLWAIFIYLVIFRAWAWNAQLKCNSCDHYFAFHGQTRSGPVLLTVCQVSIKSSTP